MRNMTFEDFCSLEVGDFVFYEGVMAHVKKKVIIKKGQRDDLGDGWYATQGHNMIELHIELWGDHGDEMRYPHIYLDYPTEVHNGGVLKRMQMIEPGDFIPTK